MLAGVGITLIDLLITPCARPAGRTVTPVAGHVILTRAAVTRIVATLVTSV